MERDRPRTAAASTTPNGKPLTEADLWDQRPFSGIVWRRENGQRVRVAMIPQGSPVTITDLMTQYEGAHGLLIIRPHGSSEIEIDVGRPEQAGQHHEPDGTRNERRARWMEEGARRAEAEARKEADQAAQRRIQTKDLEIERLEHRLGLAEERYREAQRRSERLQSELSDLQAKHRQEIRDLDASVQEERRKAREENDRLREETMQLREMLLEMRHDRGDKGFLDKMADHIGPELPSVLKAITSAQMQNSGTGSPPGRSRVRLPASRGRSPQASRETQRRPQAAAAAAHEPESDGLWASEGRLSSMADDLMDDPETRLTRPVVDVDEGEQPISNGATAPRDAEGLESRDPSNGPAQPGLSPPGRSLAVYTGDGSTIEADTPQAGADDTVRNSHTEEVPDVPNSDDLPQEEDLVGEGHAGDVLSETTKPAYKASLKSDILEAALDTARGDCSIEWMLRQIDGVKDDNGEVIEAGCVEKIRGLTASAPGSPKWDVEKSDWIELAALLVIAAHDCPIADVGRVIETLIPRAYGPNWQSQMRWIPNKLIVSQLFAACDEPASDADYQRAEDVLNWLSNR